VDLNSSLELLTIKFFLQSCSYLLLHNKFLRNENQIVVWIFFLDFQLNSSIDIKKNSNLNSDNAKIWASKENSKSYILVTQGEKKVKNTVSPLWILNANIFL